MNLPKNFEKDVSGSFYTGNNSNNSFMISNRNEKLIK